MDNLNKARILLPATDSFASSTIKLGRIQTKQSAPSTSKQAKSKTATPPILQDIAGPLIRAAYEIAEIPMVRFRHVLTESVAERLGPYNVLLTAFQVRSSALIDSVSQTTVPTSNRNEWQKQAKVCAGRGETPRPRVGDPRVAAMVSSQWIFMYIFVAVEVGISRRVFVRS